MTFEVGFGVEKDFLRKLTYISSHQTLQALSHFKQSATTILQSTMLIRTTLLRLPWTTLE